MFVYIFYVEIEHDPTFLKSKELISINSYLDYDVRHIWIISDTPWSTCYAWVICEVNINTKILT